MFGTLRDVVKQTCALVEVAEPKRGRFKFTQYDLPDLVRASSLTVGDFATARGRLSCVLAEGRLPVVWNVGRSKSSGQLRLLGQQTLLRRCLQLKNRTVIPVPKLADVSLEHSRSLWYGPARPRWCLVVGSVDGARAAAQETQRYRLCAILRADGRFEKFRAYREPEFRDEWQLTVSKPKLSWRELLAGQPCPLVP